MLEHRKSPSKLTGVNSSVADRTGAFTRADAVRQTPSKHTGVNFSVADRTGAFTRRGAVTRGEDTKINKSSAW